jgi:acetylornithine deacetylase/succinyl-diaminopimelate desuccinylase-like protein
MHDDLRSAVDELFPSLRADLEDLIRIPSVSAAAYDPAELVRSAEATAALLREAGFPEVCLLEVAGAHPAVFAEIPAPPGRPTVLLYAHHDVQPPGPDGEWETAPFEPLELNGRLLGRGSSDDKAGIVVHAGAVGAFGGRPPVGVKVFVEGEEEVGSEHLPAYLAEYGNRLRADLIVIADSGNWKVGRPALTTSLRGNIAVTVEVRALRSGVHSGLAGGPIPDALTILTRILATLHDEHGAVAVPGLVGYESDPLDLTEDDVRSDFGVLPSVRLIGEGALTSRMWTKPSISVLAIDAPPVAHAINQLLATARAKVSLRTAPGQEGAAAFAALRDHVLAADAWGAEVTVTEVERGAAFRADTSDPRIGAFRNGLAAAWGTEVAEIGIGGSIPFVADFQRLFPEAAIVLTGVIDPTSAAHGPNESVDLGDLRNAVLGEAIALRLLAG